MWSGNAVGSILIAYSFLGPHGANTLTEAVAKRSWH